MSIGAFAMSLVLVSTSLGLRLQAEAIAPQQGTSAVDTLPEMIKRDVEKIGVGKKLTAILTDGKQYHGMIQSIAADSFVLREVDLHQDLTFGYSELRKVYKGYGGKGFGGQRVNPRKSRIVGIAAAAGLLAVVIFVLTQLK